MNADGMVCYHDDVTLFTVTVYPFADSGDTVSWHFDSGPDAKAFASYINSLPQGDFLSGGHGIPVEAQRVATVPLHIARTELNNLIG